MSAVVPVEVVGGIIKAADFNFLVGGSANQRPTFFAVQNAAQSVANNTGGVHMQCQSVIRDTDSAYNSGTGVYTVKTAGIWLLSGQVQWAAGATGQRAITIGGGSNYQAVDAKLASTDTRNQATLVCFLNVNDTFVADIFQTNGGALNTVGSALCSMSAQWIGS